MTPLEAGILVFIVVFSVWMLVLLYLFHVI